MVIRLAHRPRDVRRCVQRVVALARPTVREKSNASLIQE